MRMRYLAGPVVAAVAVLGVAAAPAQAAAEKFPLVGPNAIIFCADLTPFPGEDVSQTAPGFVVFNANKNKVSAVVSVKDAPPGAELPIRLIQGGPGGGNDCFTVDGVLKVNQNGQGTLNVAEPPAGTRAQIIMDTTAIFGTPTFRGTDVFVFGDES